VAGDYDNDGKPDLLIVRSSGLMLYHNDGNGSFSDVTAATKVMATPAASRAAAFVDVDHDGDLDIFVPGNVLLRNNGDGTFTNQTAAANNVTLWRNLRDGTFRDVAQETGLAEIKGTTSVAAGDVNKDGFTDFYFAPISADTVGQFALSNGKERFQLARAPVNAETGPSQFVDYDDDGLLDLVTAGTQLHVLRNVGDAWVEVTS